MSDMEKVLKGLEICKEESKLCFGESECGYQSYFPRCWITLAADALELLKAQEPVEPVFDAGDGKTIGQFLCGKCHAKIGFGHPHFCWYCGRAVKWNG